MSVVSLAIVSFAIVVSLSCGEVGDCGLVSVVCATFALANCDVHSGVTWGRVYFYMNDEAKMIAVFYAALPARHCHCSQGTVTVRALTLIAMLKESHA